MKNTAVVLVFPSPKIWICHSLEIKTARWWIEIPFLTNVNNKLKRNTLLPCTHEDYLAACEQEIPERWWKAQRRNIL